MRRYPGLFERIIVIPFLLLGLSACESENEHFCAKYQYFYKELLKPDILPIPDIREQLQDELRTPGKDTDRARMMLFVLEDVDNGIKPEQEAPKDFCLRRKRWERF